ncbi:Mo-dependent nitrogenase C-terminal domain-containing protein [Gloeothece verrucosa]|uniref:Mo-dependent nitrogenase family protein n=1 Tax=Gloeothece verrucosa (strain PCC 7822) TaxID=497965 RepID=E0U569_GLOV7|nr:Mo-dependent nitrogenase C-terminal domain-containing protein [Gloeothece verrucosa]ADN12348.1 Mo-dependent nitrogenase family protein [Gloeothece verrucosa PCC 7822]
MNTAKLKLPPNTVIDLIKTWLDNVKIDNPNIADLICRLIPSQCPFEREIYCFGRKILHIPPLCKLNPLYEEFVGLRFRALCYLADECGKDITGLI